MTKLDIGPRALKEAKYQSLLTAQRMLTSWQKGVLRSWADLEKQYSVIVDPSFKSKPWNYANFSSFREIWKNSTEARLIVAMSQAGAEENKIKIDKNVTTFGNITLYPEQEGCYKAIKEALLESHSVKAVYQDGTMGSGKTFVAAAVIAACIEQYKNDPRFIIQPHPIQIFTPKGVVEHWKRVLELAGLGAYVANRKILLFSNGEFTTNIGEMFSHEVEDYISGETKLIWEPMLTPILAIPDEAHNYNNPSSIRTKKIRAMMKSRPRPMFLFMSATPMEKIDDSETFCLACDTEFMGTKVTEDSFSYFARLLDKEPNKPNREAVKRLRKVLAPNIFSLPYIKPKYKAINMVWLVDFVNERHREIYNSAYQRYLEVCEKVGKNTSFGQFQRFIELNRYRCTVEPLRAPWIAARMAENYKRGDIATAAGVAFKETLAEIVFQLVDKYSIPREQISIIWGGKRQYKTEDLLTREEIDNILRGGLGALQENPDLAKRIKITMKYLQDQHEHDEDATQQAYRHEKLKELKLLGKQGDNARQIEIDNFQDGTSRICVFTLASGGVGLSFDRDKDFLLPREGLFTPVYNGKEFQQVLGRLVRRASLSDAKQWITMMRGTVEEWHVAPILDEKLKCIAEITNRNFDIIELLSRELPEGITLPKVLKLRDEIAAAGDADKDDTIVTDFVKEGSDDDDEENETER